MNLNPMLLSGLIAGVLLAILLIYEASALISRRRAHKAAEEAFNDETLDDETRADAGSYLTERPPVDIFRRIFEGILIIGILASIIVFTVKYNDYKKHGAFYDDSWRDVAVEDHFIFDTADTEFLQGIYDADPTGFQFDEYNVVLVKLGCEDCEDVADIIKQIGELPEVYIIFNRSPIGKAYVDYYEISFIPTIIYDGSAAPIR